MVYYYYYCNFSCRSGPRQPTGRCVYQWTPIAQPHPAQDHRDGRGRGPAVRYFKTTQSQPRLCLQNFEQVSKNFRIFTIEANSFFAHVNRTLFIQKPYKPDKIFNVSQLITKLKCQSSSIVSLVTTFNDFWRQIMRRAANSNSLEHQLDYRII